MDTKRFAISYDKLVWLATITGGGPKSSAVEVGPDEIRVRMGSNFELAIPRSSVRSVSRSQAKIGATQGVHGRAGRWLVNGSAHGLVEITIDPPAYAERRLSTMFSPAKVTSLIVSLADPDGFIAAVTG